MGALTVGAPPAQSAVLRSSGRVRRAGRRTRPSRRGRRRTISLDVTAASTRRIGIAWAVVACPLLAWAFTFLVPVGTRGRRDEFAVVTLLLLPAALAGAVNVALGRRRRAVWAAALLAAFVSALGFVAYVIWFFLTVPPEFFT